MEKVKEAIDALPDSLEPDDLDTVQKTEAAKELYDQLTEHEKELLGSAAAEKLNRLLADAAAYRILEGDKSTWTLGSTGGSVSYTHLDVYKRQDNGGRYPACRLATVLRRRQNEF